MPPWPKKVPVQGPLSSPSGPDGRQQSTEVVSIVLHPTKAIELKHVTRPEPKEQSHPSGFAAVPLDQLPIKY